MEVTETGGVTDEPKIIIHLDTYETEKLQSGQPVQLHTGLGQSVHRTFEIRSEPNNSFEKIEEEINIIDDYSYNPQPIYDDALDALKTLVMGINQTNTQIMYSDMSVVEAYEDFISNPNIHDAIESCYYYEDVMNEYR